MSLLGSVHGQLNGLMPRSTSLFEEAKARLKSVVRRRRGRPSKTRLKASERYAMERAFKRAWKRSRLRQLSPFVIFPDLAQVAVPLGAMDPETRHPNQAEHLIVCGIAAARQARRIFEFGTYFGRTSYHLARLLPDAEVFTLDLPAEAMPRPGPYLGAAFLGAPEAARIRQIRIDSRNLDTTPYRARFDFIWIDGDHSYEVVKSDTEKAFELLAPGGVIVWHDYAPKKPGLVTYVEELTATRPLFWLESTSLLMHIDGIDPESFDAHALPLSKALISAYKRVEGQ